MSDVYRVIGSELSPYSVKVRSYCRYKGIPHEWVVRNRDNMDEFKKHAKLPLIPVVVSPDGSAMQDSTPILETLEKQFPENSIQPDDPALAYIAALLEDYGDEWGNKPMFHYRWTYEADQKSTGERIAAENLPSGTDEELAGLSAMIVKRMGPRVWFVGSSESTRDQIEASFENQVDIIEKHLVTRKYLLGDRPSFADFGIWPQLYETYTDPTPGAIIRGQAPAVEAWIQRMLAPKSEGEFENWSSLEPTLFPLLKHEVGALYLPWSDANSKAIEASQDEFSVELEGKTFSQKPQKYHAKALKTLRARLAAVSDRAQLDDILRRADCLRWLS